MVWQSAVSVAVCLCRFSFTADSVSDKHRQLHVITIPEQQPDGVGQLHKHVQCDIHLQLGQCLKPAAAGWAGALFGLARLSLRCWKHSRANRRATDVLLCCEQWAGAALNLQCDECAADP